MAAKKIKYLNRAPKIAYCQYDCHDTMKSIIPRQRKNFCVNSMCKYCKKLELGLIYISICQKYFLNALLAEPFLWSGSYQGNEPQGYSFKIKGIRNLKYPIFNKI